MKVVNDKQRLLYEEIICRAFPIFAFADCLHAHISGIRAVLRVWVYYVVRRKNLSCKRLNIRSFLTRIVYLHSRLILKSGCLFLFALTQEHSSRNDTKFTGLQRIYRTRKTNLYVDPSVWLSFVPSVSQISA